MGKKLIAFLLFLFAGAAQAQVSQKPLPGQDLNNTWTGTNKFANINNRIFADQQTGADACAKIATAWGLVPSGGGIVDATGFQGSQTCASNPFASVTSTGLTDLGGAVFPTTASWVMPQGMILRGIGRGNVPAPTYGTTAIKAIAGFPASTPVITFGAAGFGNRVEDMIVDCNNQAGAIGIQNSTGQEQAGVRNVGMTNCPGISLDIESGAQNSGHYMDFEIVAANCSNCNASTVGVKVNQSGTPVLLERATVNMNSVSPEPNVCFEFDSNGTFANLHAEECVTGFHVNSSNVTIINPQCSSLNAVPMTDCIKIEAGLSNVNIINVTVQNGGSFTVTNLIHNLTTGSAFTSSGEGNAVGWYVMGNGGSPGECSSSQFHSCTLYQKTMTLAASFTTTAATTDNVTVTGMTSSGHCYLQPTNATADTLLTGTFISAKTTNQITVTHAASAGGTFDVGCTPF